MTSPGRLALIGSGEYQPVTQDIEAWLLENRPPTYVQVTAAAAPEGAKALARTSELGAAAAERLGVTQVVVDVRNRQDADEQQLADLIAGAGLIFLSDGSANHLVTTLRGSRVWAAIREAWKSGSSLAGSGAGAMALCGYMPDFRHPKQGGADGLGLVPDLRVLPRFDRFSRMIPDSALRPLVMPGATVVGIDDDTALVATPPGEASPWEFRARGRRSCWRIESDRKYRVNAPLLLRVDA